jgi:hypothetical protein
MFQFMQSIFELGGLPSSLTVVMPGSVFNDGLNTDQGVEEAWMPRSRSQDMYCTQGLSHANKRGCHVRFTAALLLRPEMINHLHNIARRIKPFSLVPDFVPIEQEGLSMVVYISRENGFDGCARTDGFYQVAEKRLVLLFCGF